MGFHLAESLSYENKDITLIDTDKDILEHVASRLDVLTVMGDSASIDVLKNANVKDANMVMAVTTSEKTNIVTAMLAKQLGAKRVIARVRNHDYLLEENVAYFHNLGIDDIISPTMLCSGEIHRMVKNSTFSDIFEFEEGKINVMGVILDQFSSLVNKRLSDTRTMSIFEDVRIIAIVRDQMTIIPGGNTMLRNNDHVYFVSNKKASESIAQLTAQREIDIKNVMIIGGDDLAFTSALLTGSPGGEMSLPCSNVPDRSVLPTLPASCALLMALDSCNGF